MKLEIERPTHLVDISRLPLNEIEADIPPEAKPATPSTG
jgi:CO/xanthine dehydrogenase FAD-binding subunit